ncbi:taste receptor type 2 member 7-like [Cynocephalus volans]|uniref:taste receptor type 2 member 7-like n=1 Tax=Cynocephalus volans TaxID=110931 RepID=UPI002FCC10B4
MVFHVNYENIFCNKNLMISLDGLWTESNYFCMACTTCLNVFYFFEIANFSNLVFLWMKCRIHKVLLIIVLGAILSFCFCLLLKDAIAKSLIRNQLNSGRNLTWNIIGTGPRDLSTEAHARALKFMISFLLLFIT